ncbi:MAG: HD domain-containing protein [Phycisphaerales bacterium]|nr:HD domain-containing protein [Phycisphaerales bacterium]
MAAHRPSNRDDPLSELAAVTAIARDLLVVVDAAGRRDLWLWEHSERVSRLACMLAELPEISSTNPNRAALAVAGLFHDAGWALQVREGRIDRWQLLSRPTNELQRELGATAVEESAGRMLPRDVLQVAMLAIRSANDRNTAQVEAQLIAEAENLDEIGVLYVLRQFRQSQAEGRSLDQLLTTWKTHLEYRYWEARINDTLRFEATRRIARERLAGVAAMMNVLARDMACRDLAEAIQELSIRS